MVDSCDNIGLLVSRALYRELVLGAALILTHARLIDELAKPCTALRSSH